MALVLHLHLSLFGTIKYAQIVLGIFFKYFQTLTCTYRYLQVLLGTFRHFQVPSGSSLFLDNVRYLSDTFMDLMLKD